MLSSVHVGMKHGVMQGNARLRFLASRKETHPPYTLLSVHVEMGWGKPALHVALSQSVPPLSCSQAHPPFMLSNVHVGMKRGVMQG